jgi:hypothetical protein
MSYGGGAAVAPSQSQNQNDLPALVYHDSKLRKKEAAATGAGAAKVNKRFSSVPSYNTNSPKKKASAADTVDGTTTKASMNSDERNAHIHQ